MENDDQDPGSNATTDASGWLAFLESGEVNIQIERQAQRVDRGEDRPVSPVSTRTGTSRLRSVVGNAKTASMRGRRLPASVEK